MFENIKKSLVTVNGQDPEITTGSSPSQSYTLLEMSRINLALYIRDCESLCLSEETLKAVGPFYMVAMPGEVKYPTQLVNV